MRLPFLSLELSLRVLLLATATALAAVCLDMSREARGRSAILSRSACALFSLLCGWSALLVAVRVLGMTGLPVPDMCPPGLPVVISLRMWLWFLLMLLAGVWLWCSHTATGYQASAWRAGAAFAAAIATFVAFLAAHDVLPLPRGVTRLGGLGISITAIIAAIVFLRYRQLAKRERSTGPGAAGQPGSGTGRP